MNTTMQDEEARPFLKYWDYLEDLEIKRRKGQIPDDRQFMTLSFIDSIGADKFLEEAQKVHAIKEIARFYGTDLESAEDLHFLMKQLNRSTTHQEAFYYSFYFAAWVKLEVPPKQRQF
mmetsp:Transcript_44749/g.59424  ORF Transcript_44749/g.59424 Transcript_44749/m.59424 type:complete len:118 (+) Transcript_44749:93-446(+)|eukprot:CAMPEP_0185571600 /NCGR_PEP_ID=MMETSP0434-20130131/3636_1 /TAXON_ID=626734 ORGANISM="Favella taraikaensis, Strain Fe Narragansett Bay" /NCGR_SAMPLE_ID=MMETSP0434 /ASSEMBLY_ACC=CAM_ASM_000379 /LENGTH=117 /DNA_ID=CAMNT_0028187115 /DNA_START=45 /DNA_END=398 /DNA_ORIENTATION=+